MITNQMSGPDNKRPTHAGKVPLVLPAINDMLAKSLALVNHWLYPPSDLRCLISALEPIRKVVKLRALIAGTDDLEMRSLLSALNTIEEHADVVKAHFPTAIRKIGEKAAQGICTTNGLYSIFLIADKNPPEPWIALVATALPVLRKLHELAIEDKETWSNRNYLICKDIRYLPEEETETLSLLFDLPLIATSAKSMVEEMGSLSKRTGIPIESNNSFGPLYSAYRMLYWYTQGTPRWPKGERESYSSVEPRQKRERKGRGKTHLHYENVLLNAEDGELDGSDNAMQLKGFARFFAPIPLDDKMQPRMDMALRDEVPVSDLAFQVHIDRAIENHHQVRRAQASRAALYGVQALTLAAQRLPFSNNMASSFEMEKFITTLENTSYKFWNEVPKAQRSLVAAYGGYRMAFSRAHIDATQLVAVRGGDEVTDKSAWHVENDEFELNIQAPSHAQPIYIEQTVTMRDSFSLQAPPLLLRLFAPFRNRRGRIFSDACERHLKRVLEAINSEYGTELTISKICNWIARRVELLCSADQVISTYFTCKTPSTHMPSVYSSVPTSELQLAFQTAFWQLHEITDLNIAAPFQMSLSDEIDDNSPQVGTKHLVKAEVVKNTLIDLQTEIQLMYSNSGVGFADRHNIYTAYGMFIYLALTGTRPLKHFLPLVEAIDLMEGLVFTSEKDNSQYSYSRMVVLCKVLLNHLIEHHDHLHLVRSHLSLVNPDAIKTLDTWDQLNNLSSGSNLDRSTDLAGLQGLSHFFFFLDPKSGAVIAPSAELLQTFLGEEWKLRLYSLRHHFRTFLTRRRHHGESVDYSLGHMESRTQPLGTYSTMPTSIWNRGLKEQMDAFCEEFSIHPMTSPLRPNTTEMRAM